MVNKTLSDLIDEVHFSTFDRSRCPAPFCPAYEVITLFQHTTEACCQYRLTELLVALYGK